MVSRPHPSSRLAVACLALLTLIAGCGAGVPDAATPSTGQTLPTNSPVTVALLPAVQAYVDAVNNADLDALTASFSTNAEVVDVSRHIRGSDVIRRWAEREVMGGALRVEGVAQPTPDTQRLRVHWAPAGSNGWAADYTFTVVGRQILTADLQYAD